jgi:ABC-type enterochelin transport system substrate-binding protein
VEAHRNDQLTTSLSWRQGFLFKTKTKTPASKEQFTSVMKRLNRLIIVLSAVLLLGACAPAATPAPTEPPAPTLAPTSTAITVTDSAGKNITLAAPAQRIISLSPASTESLFALGAGEQIVGRDTFSDYPEQAKSITDIGGGFGELNVEAILAQNPDLVLASLLTPPEQTKALEDAGLTIYTLGNPKDFDEMYVILETLARLTGHETESASLIDNLNSASPQSRQNWLGSASVHWYSTKSMAPILTPCGRQDQELSSTH